MNSTQKTKLVAFSNQKGGVGKTAFTTLTASLLHYRHGYNVVIFDCDFPQHSLHKMRERDMKNIMQNEVYKKMAHHLYTTINKKAYPVIQCKPDQALQVAKDFIQVSPVPIDIVFFDLPGTVNTPGVLTTLAGVHYIFSTITADRLVMESSLSFTDVLTNVLMKKEDSTIEDIRLFWNQRDRREKTTLYEAYEQVINALGLSLMQSSITDSKRFRKEGELTAKSVFRSTLLPPDEKLMKTCGFDLFLHEFLQTIKL